MAISLVTGATGFLGSHLVEALANRGTPVRALARAGRDTTEVERDGVEIARGDLADDQLPGDLLDAVDTVYHCAAKVGDWGPAEDYRRVNVGGLRNLLDACAGRNIRRVVVVSSLGVYAARDHYQTDESEPLPERHIDGYTQTKVEAEKLALEYHRERGVPVVVVRPGFIYGPRDRSVLPPLVEKLRLGQVMYLAQGRRALNTTFVGNAVQALLLAAERAGVEGEVFNVTDGEFVSKRRFLEAVADGLGLRRPRISVPMFVARRAARFLERYARKRNWTAPPRLTQARLKFLGYNLDFSIAKARRVLGYSPATSFDEGMRQTLAWFASREGQS